MTRVGQPLRAAVIVLAFAAGLSAQTGSGGINKPEHRDKPHVVLVSMDGFKPDYLDRFALPNLKRVLQRGVRASMRPVFPSLTFPNHLSLVTGMHPQNHGIVNNSFYDPSRRQKYELNDATVTDGSWYRGEPIWVTAETQGMVAACFFWPGSEADIKGVRPTFFNKYDGKVPNDVRVRGVLGWLRMPEESRPHAITLYFSELDTASHDGPLDADGVAKASLSLDRSIGMLLDGIDALPIRDRVYLLLTSDHGMAEASRSRTVLLDTVADLSEIEQVVDGAVTSIHVRGGDLARATTLRDGINARLKSGRAYLRGELPERFHYRQDPRAGDVIVIMEEGWQLRRPSAKRSASERWGAHGWDNTLPSMQALFVAMGPSIRTGVTVEGVENVDVYPLITELLSLRPAAGIDGRPGYLRRLIGK